MVHTSRLLRKLKEPSAAQVADYYIRRMGTTSKEMEKWADREVISLLNSRPNPIQKRITHLVELCRNAIQLTERITQCPAQRTAEEVALRDERHEVSLELNARLSKYRWTPVILNSMTVDSYFHVHFVAGPNPVVVDVDPFSKRMALTTPTGAAFLENKAVEWIVRNIGAVHRIRRCHRSQCRKWFFAVTDHQKYCGDECRKQDAAQGESFKGKRREYMKRYRNNEKKLDATAKRLAKGGSK
jgi:hypothetical protein